MGLAAKISIAIDAQTASLQKGFGEATTAINKLNGGLSNNVAMGMAKFNLAVGAAKAVLDVAKAAIDSFWESAARLKDLGNLADRIGIASNALSALRYIAEANGSSADTMTKALAKMSQGINEAARGSGEAKESLAALGLSVQELQQLTPERQFGLIADAINKAGNAASQNQIAMKIFGEEGASLNKVIDLGSAGLAAWGMKAANAGAATESMTKASQELSQATAKMNAMWTNFKDALASAVFPWITELIADFNLLAEAVFGAFRWAFVKDESNPLKAIDNQVGKLVTTHATAKKSMKSMESAAKDTAKAVKESFADVPKPADWKTAGIGAVTRGSAAGFSAVQEAQRQRQDEERRHKDLVTWLARINESQRASAIHVSTVSL